MSRIVLVSAVLVLGALVFVPSASAEAALPCSPYLPLWDDAMCAVETTVAVAAWATHVVTCDVVGGPACGLISWG